MPSPPDRPPLRIAIVGGGFSGLATAISLIDRAQACGRDLELTVFEASGTTGGLVGTRQIGDYLVETGADAFITNKPGGVAMCRRLGLESRLISTDPRFRQSFILFKGRPVPTPAGFQLMAPTRIAPFLKSPLLSWRGKKRVLAEPDVPRRTGDDEESIGSFVRRRFGQEAYDRIVQPMVGGIYTGDLDRLSLAATFPRFEQMERRQGSILRGLRRERGESASGARYGLFVSLPEGMSQLLSAMRNEIEKSQAILTGVEVQLLSRCDGSGWRLLTNAGERNVDAVVLAVPATVAASLLQGIDSTLAGELEGIEYTSSAIVVSGHRLTEIDHPVNGAGLVIPHVEKRRILAVSFGSRKFPGRAPEGRVILRTFLGGALQADLLSRDDAELKQVVREELGEILGVRGTPDFSAVVRYPRGIPQFVIGHRQRVARAESRVSQLSGLALAGNAYHGVGIPDAIQSGTAAAAKLWSDFQLPADASGKSNSLIDSTGIPSHDLPDSGHHTAAGLTQ